MNTIPYIPLRAHSEFSITDGIIRIGELAKAAAEHGYPAVALTDLMNTFGLLKFYKACRKAGVKPILGAEVRIANPKQLAQPFRALLLIRNHSGYVRLGELLTLAHTDEHRDLIAPQLQEEWLAEGDNSGLICLSGAQWGEIGQA